jgi:hypothetical protein
MKSEVLWNAAPFSSRHPDVSEKDIASSSSGSKGKPNKKPAEAGGYVKSTKNILWVF